MGLDNVDIAASSLADANFGREAQALLNWLAAFGADHDGGVTRPVYSKAWRAAQTALCEKMKAYGMEPRFDRVGNLFGRVTGRLHPRRRVVTGSHIDTVERGGRYDGALGIVAGMLAVHYLTSRFGPPRLTMEVVSFCEEEGSRFPLGFWGSTYVARSQTDDFSLTIPDVQDAAGTRLLDAMRQMGLPSHADDSDRDEIAAFVELHVEQGMRLEEAQCPIGIVEQIVGQRRYLVDVRGESNHAGTTPMDRRRDPMHGAASMIRCALELARRRQDGIVATVGRLQVAPNVSNVIPERIRFTLDVRHWDEAILDAYCEEVLEAFRRIAAQHRLAVSHALWLDQRPVAMHRRIIQHIESACRAQQADYLFMPSWAGHDAQIMAQHVPTGLIFVPSRHGISHSPEEYTNPADLDVGVRVLAATLYRLAYCEEEP
ncbi:Zn-dependent hydrolase [Alicyclobacillus cellulosilyticus]|nr:Zn-dependent hydrolase [Alicyclobacillus cellulosilyticus]